MEHLTIPRQQWREGLLRGMDPGLQFWEHRELRLVSFLVTGILVGVWLGSQPGVLCTPVLPAGAESEIWRVVWALLGLHVLVSTRDLQSWDWEGTSYHLVTEICWLQVPATI